MTQPLLAPKLSQIGIVVRDAEEAGRRWGALFGVAPEAPLETEELAVARTEFEGAPTPARAKLVFLHLENITLEFIEPIGGPSTWQAALDAGGDGFHHIAVVAPGFEEKLPALAALGLEVEQRGQWTMNTGGQYAYLKSKDAAGIRVELVEEFGGGERR